MFHHLTIGEKAPEIINTVIEIPKGCHNKYEYDEELDVIRLDRVLHSAMYYPTDYGFVPETRSEDGDHLDVMMFISAPVFPGCLVEVRVIGMLAMEDEAGIDNKLIAVAKKDPNFKHVESVQDLPPHQLDEIVHFFERYKDLEGKWAKPAGWQSKEEAFRIIKEGQERYKAESK